MDICKMVDEIAMQAIENQEEFIFKTIHPYCENVLQMKINKEKLKQILLNGIKKQQPCEDCISRQAVLDLINADWKYENLESDIVNLPSVTPKVKWIPVSERLPEANGRYYVTIGLNACGSLWNRVYIVNYSDLMGLKSERIWWDGNVGKSDFKRIDDVIAWMPLPQPYIEREVEE